MSSKLYTCERCGRPAQICHHKKHLDDVNVHDPTVALSFDNLEALCIDCHNTEHGSPRDLPLFSPAGEIVGVREGSETQQYQRDREQIDDVVARARALFSVVSCESEV